MATARGRRAPIAVYLEQGPKRVFACAVDWPGWCRSGKNDEAALEALAAYTERYEVVVREAGLKLPAGAGEELDVVETVAGSATTDFGAPGSVPEVDRQPLTAKQTARLADVVAASWTVFDAVVANSPAELRKGPRGGGRDRDKMVDHVLAAEVAYARKIGVRRPQPDQGDRNAIGEHREAIISALRGSSTGEPPAGKGWPPRYAARRIAWHVLDHAWEMEDQREPAKDA